MYALVFVIIAVIRAGLTRSRKEADHLVLVQIHAANVGVVILVVVVKYAGFAGGGIGIAHVLGSFSCVFRFIIHEKRAKVKPPKKK